MDNLTQSGFFDFQSGSDTYLFICGQSQSGFFADFQSGFFDFQSGNRNLFDFQSDFQSGNNIFL